MSADNSSAASSFFNETIARLLVEALGAASLAELAITALGGGITNRNYRVDLGSECFVVRVGSKGAELLGIDRAREHHASRIAAHLGIGAEVIYSNPEADLLITRFIDGAVLTIAEAAAPAMLARIADCLRSYHAGPDFQGTFSPFETVRRYCELARAHQVSFPQTIAVALEKIAQIEHALPPLASLKPCHNDLLAANFIDDGAQIRLIDWEYAAMGDPFFDLGNFAVNQELSPAAGEQLLRCYFGEVRGSARARLELMRLASDLRESCWGFLQSGISTLDFDFYQYGSKHLARFLANAAGPQFNRYLSECTMKD